MLDCNHGNPRNCLSYKLPERNDMCLGLGTITLLTQVVMSISTENLCTGAMRKKLGEDVSVNRFPRPGGL
jgi:hypothetical protein